MLETSKDILNVVIAISIFGLAFFICWSGFYLAMMLRQIFKIIKEMRDRTHKIDEIIKLIKKKIEHSTSSLALISEGVKKLVEVVKERAEKREKKKKKSDKKDKKDKDE